MIQSQRRGGDRRFGGGDAQAGGSPGRPKPIFNHRCRMMPP